MKTSIQAILTDFDGVIRHFPRERDHAIESEFGLPSGSLNKTAFLPDLLHPVVTGQTTDEQWRTSIADSLSTHIGSDRAQAAVARWSDFPGTIDRKIFDLIFSFKSKVPIALLTNATTRLNSDLAMLGLSNNFSMIFNSSEIGCCKPDPRIFEYAVQKLNCTPSEILFIDDSLGHVDGAKTVGITTHHFRGFQVLNDFLRDVMGA